MQTTLSLSAVLLAVGAAIGGGVVAAFITSIIAPRMNEYFGLRMERRKLLNSALHKLLDLYATARLRDVDGYLRRIKESWIEGLVPEGFSEEEVNNLFARMTDARLPTPGESFTHIDFLDHANKQLNTLISDIAPFDPVLAFKISRRHTRVHTTLEQNPKEGQYETLDDVMWINQRQRLEEDLRALSWKISLRCYLKVKFELWRWARDSRRERDQILGEIFSRDLKPKLIDILMAMRAEREAISKLNEMERREV